MKNPLSNLSRPKALGLAGVAAGVLAISGSAAAINVGLLGSGASEPFTPQKVASTESAPSTTVTTDSPEPEVVYQDVYEHVSGTAASPAGPAVSSEGSMPESDDPGGQGDDSDGPSGTYVDDDEDGQDDDQYGEDEDEDEAEDDSDDHAEDESHEVEYEDDDADD